MVVGGQQTSIGKILHKFDKRCKFPQINQFSPKFVHYDNIDLDQMKLLRLSQLLRKLQRPLSLLVFNLRTKCWNTKYLLHCLHLVPPEPVLVEDSEADGK